jgi:mRNA-degrading endonuclease toxin of MazEF toxin-antitoxin module
MAETQSRQTKRLPPQETHKSAPDDNNFDDSELDQIFETPHLTAHGKTLAMPARRAVYSTIDPTELGGLGRLYPITRRDRDWSFHVPIPDGCEISGVVQADQLRSVSWEQRGSRFICKAPTGVLDKVQARLKPLLSL